MRKAILTKQLIIMTSEQEHKAIKDLSDIYEISMGDLIRQLIRNKLEEVQINQEDRKAA